MSVEETTTVLLQRAAGGDDAALDRLYRRYRTPLRRWASGRLPGWARELMDTEDLVQETLLRSLRQVNDFDGHGGGFQAYLRQGILNRIRDEMRRLARRPVRAGTAGGLVDGRPSPVEEVLGREAVRAYDAALDRLRPAEQDAVIGRVELGLSYAELAGVLDKPSADAARMAVRRSLIRLAAEMSSDG